MHTSDKAVEEGSPQAVESGTVVQGQHAGAAGWLVGGGEMGERIRAFDWSKTPLGPFESWSPALRTMVRILLANRFPHILWWGPQYIQFYNDPYRPIPGSKHPERALGRPASECWAEIWHVIGPLIDTPFNGGPATWDEDIFLEVDRYGFVEETHFTIAYSPVPDEAAPRGIGGVLATVHEITEKVIGERRVMALRDLGARVGEAKTAEEACRIAAETLAIHNKDTPFVLLYLIDADGTRAHLAGAAGVEKGQDISPLVVDLSAAQEDGWPLAEARQREAMQVVEPLDERFATVPPGPWSDPPHTAVVVPIPSNKAHEPAGLMVAAVSARLKLDQYYRDFLELIRTQVATGIANARAYEEERRRAEALAELDRAKTAFFSNVSHEFRTPLTLMLGPIEDLLNKSYTDLTPASKGQLEVVHRNSLRLLRLVNTMLDFARIEAGRARANYQPTNLAAFTAELASSFRSACERAGVTLLVHCPLLPERVYVDRDMWEKIVLNLVSNAFKFTLDGEIEVRLEAVEGRAHLTVRDTGVGIPAEELPRMFERFHRVRQTQGRTHEGTGIGLALVQELVKLHGGDVRVESVLEEGSRFIVTLPFGALHLDPERIGVESGIASTATGSAAFVEEALRWLPGAAQGEPVLLRAVGESPEPPGRGSGEAQARGPRPRIVWADDNADMRDYVCRLLGERFEVEAVADGEAALEVARHQPPDLVLSDIMMPRLDGIGLLRELRADPHLCDVPVILLSARAGEEARVEGMEAGADDYLIKPFSARELVARVETHARMSRMRKEAQAALRESEARLASQKEALELAVRGASIDAVLNVIVLAAQEHAGDDARTAIFIVDADGAHLRFGASGGMPEAYAKAVDGIVIGPQSPLCGTAAYTGQAVIVRDVATDPLWAPYLKLAREHGIRACFSFPIHSFGGKVLGTLAVYHGTPRDPQPHAVEMISLLAQTAGVIIEWHNAIDERKRAEAQRQQFVSLAENSHEFIGMCDLQFRPFFVNEAGLRMVGLGGLGQAVQTPVQEFFFPEDQAFIMEEFFPQVLRDGYSEVEVRFRHFTTGEPLWMICAVFTLRDATGLPAGFATVSRNITERKQAEAALKEADRRKDEFLATLAHELRNPLAPIRNGVEILTLQGSSDPTLRAARDMIDRQVQHLVRLIDDLLDLSRITRGTLELRREHVELAAVVAQALEASRPDVESAGHALTVSLPPQPIALDADPVRLAQVFVNLLHNACKYTEPGGRIWLTAERDGADVVVKVKDTGIGIPPDHLPRLFEMFSQVASALERSQGGLGIGLALVRNLVELHGGRVEAYSDGPGMGSAFVVRLPVLTEILVPQPPRPVNLDDVTTATPRRILVVDDNRISARSFAMLLRLSGHEVETAHDGLEAVQKAEAYRPDVILLDIGLPKLNGYDACRVIRAQPWGQPIVLVAVTGWGRDNDRRKSHEAGFDAHLVKPVDRAALLKLLASSRSAQGGEFTTRGS